MFDYLLANPQIFYVMFFSNVVICVTGFYLGGKWAEKKFVDIKPSQALFREKWVSGYSEKSWLTRFGGASRVLDVMVTKHALCIKGIFPFLTFIGSFFGVSQLVPIKHITKAELFDKDVKVVFTDAKGRHSIVLRLGNPNEFQMALKAEAQ